MQFHSRTMKQSKTIENHCNYRLLYTTNTIEFFQNYRNLLITSIYDTCDTTLFSVFSKCICYPTEARFLGLVFSFVILLSIT